MELRISKEILARADRCLKKYHCLSCGGSNCSTAQVQLVGKQRFVCSSVEPCAYKIPFGCNFFCSCPVRQEMFDQTGK